MLWLFEIIWNAIWLFDLIWLFEIIRIKSDTPVFGYFFYYTLDMAVCPYLASIFGMPIWHPKNKAQVDQLLEAGVEV
jgi:hypothetical protein